MTSPLQQHVGASRSGSVGIVQGCRTPAQLRCSLPERGQIACTATAKRPSTSERIGISRRDNDANGAQEQVSPNLRAEAKQDKIVICDRIIKIFRQKPTSEWRKLIAFSKQWPTLSDTLFMRLEDRVKSATDTKDKSELKKLKRKLKDVHDELQGFNAVLRKVMLSSEEDWDSLVASGRASFSTDFFQHLENLMRANHDDVSKRDELARIGTKLMVIVNNVDQTASNADALRAAGEEFKSLLEKTKSIEDADKRIDELAKSGKLDPALMLTMAKAYAAAKDTDYTKEQVKDVMAHLYFKAKESFAAQQPASVRILKHLLYIESPRDRREAMDQAFTPGPQLSTGKEDFLTTTPEELEQLMVAILNQYESQSQSSMQNETNALMNPVVISNMQELLLDLRKHYR